MAMHPIRAGRLAWREGFLEFDKLYHMRHEAIQSQLCNRWEPKACWLGVYRYKALMCFLHRCSLGIAYSNARARCYSHPPAPLIVFGMKVQIDYLDRWRLEVAQNS